MGSDPDREADHGADADAPGNRTLSHRADAQEVPAAVVRLVALGVDVGGKTPDEARILLENRVATFTDQPVTLAWKDQQWAPKPEQLGMAVNLDGTIDKAYNVGRQGDLLDNLLALIPRLRNELRRRSFPAELTPFVHTHSWREWGRH